MVINFFFSGSRFFHILYFSLPKGKWMDFFEMIWIGMRRVLFERDFRWIYSVQNHVFDDENLVFSSSGWEIRRLNRIYLRVYDILWCAININMCYIDIDTRHIYCFVEIYDLPYIIQSKTNNIVADVAREYTWFYLILFVLAGLSHCEKIWLKDRWFGIYLFYNPWSK